MKKGTGIAKGLIAIFGQPYLRDRTNSCIRLRSVRAGDSPGSRFVRSNLRRAQAGGLLLIAATSTQAMDMEVTGGYTFGRSGGFTSVPGSCGRNFICKDLYNAGAVNVNLITDNDSLLPTEWTVGYIFGQKKNPDNYWNNDDPTSYVGVGKRLEWRRFFLGFGIVAVDRLSQRLSSTWNFKTQLGFHYGHFVMLVQHISNSGIQQPNDGEDLITLGLRFEFARI